MIAAVIPAGQIEPMWHRLEMVGIDARPDRAEMINLQNRRDWPPPFSILETRRERFAVVPRPPIAVSTPIAEPVPATRIRLWDRQIKQPICDGPWS